MAVNGFEPSYQLNGHVQNGLEGELPLAQVKDLFQILAQQLHDQYIVVAALAKVVDNRKAIFRAQSAINVLFDLQLW